MPQSSAVKFFLSSHAGAPTLTGAAGDMAALLHACLVTGFNASAVDSITRNGTTVTVTVSAGHGLEAGVVVQISGADQAEYNGDHRITNKNATTFDYELEAAETPATPATGTISCCQAPAGWERAFVSGDNQRAAFRSLAVDATGMYFYIDDTNTQGTRRCGVKGYESMTDIDSRINPFPYSSADDQWYWWYKSAVETTAIHWTVVADDKLVYLWWNRDAGETGGRLNAFGDFISYVPSDSYNFIVTGESHQTDEKYQPMLATIPNEYSPGASITRSGISIARDYLGTAAAQSPGAAAVIDSVSSDRYPVPIGWKGVAFPSPITGGAIISPVDLSEVTSGTKLLRGRQPGLFNPYHERPYSRTEPELVSGAGDYADRQFVSVPFMSGAITMSAGPGGGGYYHTYGQALIDIIGPWRD